MDHSVLIQAAAVVAPLMVTGLIAWNHLSGKVSEVQADVRAQNSRIGKLEINVVYKDTCQAMHDQTVQAVMRIQDVTGEARQERKDLALSLQALQGEMGKRGEAIAELLALTRRMRTERGLAPDYKGARDAG